MAAPVTLNTITFTNEFGDSNPQFTFADVWGDDSDLVVSFTGEVLNDSCAADSPIIAGSASYTGPVNINFDKAVSGISLDAGCFDAVRSTRVVIYGENDFKVERTVNPNDDATYHHFNFQFGENVIKRVAIFAIGNEPSGFAVDNVTVTLRPESEPVSKSNNAAIDSLISANKWADKTILWSFAKSDSDRPGYGDGPQTFGTSKLRLDTQGELSAGQKAMVRKSMDMWDDVADIKFKKVADGDDPGQLRFSRADINAPADAFFPGDSAQAGDVTIRTNRPLGEKDPGTREFTAIILHEVGHAIGLSHPQSANGQGTALPAADDSIERSVMSYRSVLGGGLPGIPSDGNHGEGPMMNDISAIQYLYGANYKHNRGDTLYQFDPTEDKIFRTIWDGNGTDTYDASLYANNVKIDLAPGAWSTLLRSQRAVLEANGAGAADDALASGNVANARLHNNDIRSLIENAKGGAGNDRLFGNQGDNILTGNSGNDKLFGRGSDDILRGGGGSDKLFGGNGADLLRGDSGRDEMTGGGGDDLFVFLRAAHGGVRERIHDFTQGDDLIVLSTIDANSNLAGNQAFSFIGDSPFTAAGQLRAITGGGDTLLLGDVDGDGQTDFRVFLTGEMVLSVSDIVL